MKSLKCPKCSNPFFKHIMIGGPAIRYGHMNEYGDIIYGEIFVKDYVHDNYVCNNCGHETHNLKDFIVEIPEIKKKEKSLTREVCLTLADVMCEGCPHVEGFCQPTSANFETEEEYNAVSVNYAQMNMCLLSIEDRRNNIYPDEEKLDYPACEVYPNWQPARKHCGACHQELPDEELDRICCNCGQRI